MPCPSGHSYRVLETRHSPGCRSGSVRPAPQLAISIVTPGKNGSVGGNYDSVRIACGQGGLIARPSYTCGRRKSRGDKRQSGNRENL